VVDPITKNIEKHKAWINNWNLKLKSENGQDEANRALNTFYDFLVAKYEEQSEQEILDALRKDRHQDVFGFLKQFDDFMKARKESPGTVFHYSMFIRSFLRYQGVKINVDSISLEEKKIIPQYFRSYVKSRPKLLSLYLNYKQNFRTYFRIPKKMIFRIIDEKTDKQKLMINIGGGQFFKRHWKVLDFPTSHYIFKKGIVDYEFDLTQSIPFPFKDNSVTFFYSSNTLEHIPQEFCQYLYDEIYRCLNQGGAVRIQVPDYDLAKISFLANDLDFFRDKGEKGMEQRFVHFFAAYFTNQISAKEVRDKLKTMNFEEFADYLTKRIPRESIEDNHGGHINWWNYEKLNKMLSEAGFKQIFQSYPHGSKFDEMQGVGDIFSGFDSKYHDSSIFVEAIN